MACATAADNDPQGLHRGELLEKKGEQLKHLEHESVLPSADPKGPFAA